MNIQGILLYCGRAARFAAMVGAAWAAVQLFCTARAGRKLNRRRFALQLVFVCYLAALTEIIALRGLQPAVGAAPQLVPLGTLGKLVKEFLFVLKKPARLGLLDLDLVLRMAWPLVYNVVGNLVWFLPLGALGPAVFPALQKVRYTALGSAGVSALLELLQFLLGTGTPDVDDLLLNTLGGVLGWCIWRLWVRFFAKS